MYMRTYAVTYNSMQYMSINNSTIHAEIYIVCTVYKYI